MVALPNSKEVLSAAECPPPTLPRDDMGRDRCDLQAHVSLKASMPLQKEATLVCDASIDETESQRLGKYACEVVSLNEVAEIQLGKDASDAVPLDEIASCQRPASAPSSIQELCVDVVSRSVPVPSTATVSMTAVGASWCAGEQRSTVGATIETEGHKQAQESLGLTLRVENVHFSQLSAKPTLRYAFEEAVKKGIATQAQGSISTEHILLTLSAGSVIVDARITIPGTLHDGSSDGSLKQQLQARLCESNSVLADAVVAKLAEVRALKTFPRAPLLLLWSMQPSCRCSACILFLQRWVYMPGHRAAPKR
jgi:hypothetical protein